MAAVVGQVAAAVVERRVLGEVMVAGEFALDQYVVVNDCMTTASLNHRSERTMTLICFAFDTISYLNFRLQKYLLRLLKSSVSSISSIHIRHPYG